MNYKIYDTLPGEAAMIRKAVFVEEQGFENEFDDIDSYANHLVLFDNDKPIATCRFFKKQENESYIVGRIAVVKQYRGQNIGAYLLKIVEEKMNEINGKYIFLHSQVRAKEFYEKQGYLPYGAIDYDENCPHIWMYKEIKESKEC